MNEAVRFSIASTEFEAVSVPKQRSERDILTEREIELLRNSAFRIPSRLKGYVLLAFDANGQVTSLYYSNKCGWYAATPRAAKESYHDAGYLLIRRHAQ